MKLFIFLLAGLLCGPSFLNFNFPPSAAILLSISTCGFLFVAGLELSLKTAKKNFSQALRLSAGAFVLPFLMGILTALYLLQAQSPSLQMILFLAIALSISALPITIQFLKDLHLYHTELGNLIISAATLCDIVAWIGFSFLLSPEGLSSWISTHMSLGFFFLGVLFSDRSTFAPKVRLLLTKISTWFFGPVFFISIGWKLNLWQNFDLQQVVLVFFAATFSKLFGSYLAAKSLGYSGKKSSLVALALNARGAVEIILANLALQQNLIDPRLFTTLVVMAVLTSLLPSPLTHLLKLKDD